MASCYVGRKGEIVLPLDFAPPREAFFKWRHVTQPFTVRRREADISAWIAEKEKWLERMKRELREGVFEADVD